MSSWHAEHLDLIGQERIESERNSTLDMELQIRGMTPSHRHMDINAQFLQSELRVASHCQEHGEDDLLCKELKLYMATNKSSGGVAAFFEALQ